MAWAYIPPATLETYPAILVGVLGHLPCDSFYQTNNDSADAGYVVIKAAYPGGYVMIQQVNIPNYYALIGLSGELLTLQPTQIGGAWWWKGAGSSIYSGVYTQTLAPGTTPLEYTRYQHPHGIDPDPALPRYDGDAFYELRNHSEGYEAFKRGSLSTPGALDGATAWPSAGIIRRKTDFPYWTSSTLTGEYAPQGTATGTRAVGNATWVDNIGATWTQEVSKTRLGDYGVAAAPLNRPSNFFNGWAPGRCMWNVTASAYVVGTYGALEGWWQNTVAPVRGDGYSLTFTMPAGAEMPSPRPANITMTPSEYVEKPEQRICIYAFQPGVMI